MEVEFLVFGPLVLVEMEVLVLVLVEVELEAAVDGERAVGGGG